MDSRRGRRVIVGCAVVAALTATMVLPAQASTDVFHSSFKGQEAAALLSSLSGCTETDALVVAEQSRLRDGPGAPARQTDVQVQVIQIDECAPTLISDAFGSAVVPDSAFTIDKKLSSA